MVSPGSVSPAYTARFASDPLWSLTSANRDPNTRQASSEARTSSRSVCAVQPVWYFSPGGPMLGRPPMPDARNRRASGLITLVPA
jgi:hypothetical protein